MRNHTLKRALQGLLGAGMAMALCSVTESRAQGVGMIATNFGTIPIGTFGSWAQASDGNLYGPSTTGLYRMTPGGSYSLAAAFGDLSTTNLPALPQSGVIASGNSVFGTTMFGGPGNKGTVYEYNVVSNTFRFWGVQGIASYPELLPQTRDGVNLFIVDSSYSPSNSFGTIACISNGVPVWTNLFDGTYGKYPCSQPCWGLDGYLYGCVAQTSTSTNGGVIRIDPATGSVTLLGSINNGAFLDGPECLAAGPNGEFFGITVVDGHSGVFRFDPGTGSFMVVHPFTGQPYPANVYPSILVGPDNALYGAAYVGGTNGDGNLYRALTNGSYRDIYSFKGKNGGRNPWSPILGSDNNIYVNTHETNNNAWRFSVPMQPTIASFVPDCGGSTFTFDSVAGQKYALESSTNLLDWVQVGSPVTATSGVTSLLDTNLYQVGFYRIAILTASGYSHTVVTNGGPALSQPVFGYPSNPACMPAPPICTNCVGSTNPPDLNPGDY